jgi:hypothetical protein
MSSHRLSIAQTYRQPLLLILSTLLNSSTLPISPVLPNLTLSHHVIPALFHRALDNPSSKSPALVSILLR